MRFQDFLFEVKNLLKTNNRHESTYQHLQTTKFFIGLKGYPGLFKRLYNRAFQRGLEDYIGLFLWLQPQERIRHIFF